MKLMKKVIAASLVMIGSLLLWFSVSNLEFQEYTDSPLFDWKILCAVGIGVLIPAFIILIREE